MFIKVVFTVRQTDERDTYIEQDTQKKRRQSDRFISLPSKYI